MKNILPKSTKNPFGGLSLGGHRNITILFTSLTLFVALCVYFVNAVVLTPADDPAYRAQAEAAAQRIKFNTSLLKQAQDFSANANRSDLPAGRTNPFAP